MNKQKSKNNKCDKLKAKVKKMKQQWYAAEDLETEAHRNYRKEIKKYKDLLVPYKAKWKSAKKESDALKKKYKSAKKKFKSDCQPETVGEVMVVWKAPEKAIAQVEDTKKKKKVKGKVQTKSKVEKASEKRLAVEKKPAKGVVKLPVAAAKPIVKKAAKNVTPVAKKTSQKTGVGQGQKDNLKKIEGIGPKIEQLLHAENIQTFKNLAEAKVEKIQEILTAAGPRFRMHKPATWARQAKIAAEGGWEELKAWQDKLKGGKE